MYLLNKKEAIQAMREGKTIGFLDIKGVEMWLSDGHFLFKHRCGKIETLNQKTIRQEDGYILVENTHKNIEIKLNRYNKLELIQA